MNEVKNENMNNSYQYRTNQAANNYPPMNGNSNINPPQKKKKGKKVFATILVLMILAGILGAAFYVVKIKDISIKDIVKIDSINKNATTDASADLSLTGNVSDSDEEIYVVATDVSALVEKVMPSIVIIDNTYSVNLEDYGYEDGEALTGSTGSGVIIGQNDTELLIVTNYHVIEDADDLSVHFVNGTSKSAYIKGINSGIDLAVICVPLSEVDDATMNAITFATMGDSDELKLGEPAIAIGNALGQGQSVTVGVISALNRPLTNDDGSEGLFIQTDAAINHGNSGGALLNVKGELIGINSRKAVTDSAEGMGFAIPISVAKPIIEDLMQSETKYKVDKDNRGVLGVTAYTPTGVEGAYISSVDSGSAAEEAGLEVGDVIVKVEDAKIASREELDTNLAYYEAGQTITITVLRKGNNGYTEVEIEVTLKSQKSSKSTSSGKKESDSNSSDKDTAGNQSDESDSEESENEDSGSSDGADDFGF